MTPLWEKRKTVYLNGNLQHNHSISYRNIRNSLCYSILYKLLHIFQLYLCATDSFLPISTRQTLQWRKWYQTSTSKLIKRANIIPLNHGRSLCQRSHLQEVLVGQHHLEPHFSQEDPKNPRNKLSEGFADGNYFFIINRFRLQTFCLKDHFSILFVEKIVFTFTSDHKM